MAQGWQSGGMAGMGTELLLALVLALAITAVIVVVAAALMGGSFDDD